MRKFTRHSRPAFCNPFPLTSPFPKKRSPLSTLDTLPSFRLWMISSMLSASKPPRKTHALREQNSRLGPYNGTNTWYLIEAYVGAGRERSNDASEHKNPLSQHG